MRPLRNGLAALLLAAFFIAPARASNTIVVYNSFGPGDGFNSVFIWTIIGTSGAYSGQAHQFTPSATGYLSSVELPLVRLRDPGLVNISLVRDAGGSPTGDVLESFANVVDSNHIWNGGYFPPSVVPSITNPLLEAGVTYWLRVEPATTDTRSGWGFNNQGFSTAYGYSLSPGVWQVSPPANYAATGNDGVFRVTVTAVPEPVTCAVCGMLLLALTRRIR